MHIWGYIILEFQASCDFKVVYLDERKDRLFYGEKNSFSVFPPYAIQQELAFKSNQQFRTIRLIEKNIALHFASVQASKSVFPVNKVLQHSPLVLISDAEKGFP